MKIVLGSSDRGLFLDGYRAYLMAIAMAELPDTLRGKIGASDIVQDTLLKGLENHLTFQGTSREEFAKWLRTILLNLLANHEKAFYSQKRDLDREVSADPMLECPQQASPSSIVMGRETRNGLEQALRQLPDSYQEVIQFGHRHNLTFLEIGQRLGKTEDAARKMWARAIERLKEGLQRHE